MQVYNASKAGNSAVSALSHFTTNQSTCAYRIESMFAHQFKFAVRHDLTVDLYHNSVDPIRYPDAYTKNISFEQLLQNFCDHVTAFELKGYELKVERPLELLDCWGDDPIGSGGLEIFDLNSMPVHQIRELKSLFHPFYDVVERAHVFNYLTKKEVKAIQKRYESNNIFKSELLKRKQRALAVGNDPQIIQYEEIVWLDLTFKLKSWALGKNYDSFSYINTAEGEGEYCYVTLASKQVIEQSGVIYRFDREKYLTEARKLLVPYILGNGAKRQTNQNGEAVKMLWFGQDPMEYFTAVKPVKA